MCEICISEKVMSLLSILIFDLNVINEHLLAATMPLVVSQGASFIKCVLSSCRFELCQFIVFFDQTIQCQITYLIMGKYVLLGLRPTFFRCMPKSQPFIHFAYFLDSLVLVVDC